jgi:hypothetical protein
MPAKDIYHDAVVRALRKEGWVILNEQYTLALDKRRLWIDIRAGNENIRRVILVEVKSFYQVASPVEAMASAIGKYLLYRAIMTIKGIQEELYLAIPKHAYDGIFSEKVGEALLNQVQVRLIVFDTAKEEISQWIE